MSNADFDNADFDNADFDKADLVVVCAQFFVAVDEDGNEGLASVVWEGVKPEDPPEGWLRWIGEAYEVTLVRGRLPNESIQ